MIDRSLIERPTDCQTSGARLGDRSAVDGARSELLREPAVPTLAPPDPDVIAARARRGARRRAPSAATSRARCPGAAGTPEIWQFPGGHANLTYLVALPAARLRAAPRRRTATSPPGAHDMGREYRVLSVLYQGFPPAPRAYVYCEDTAVIGAPFFVMERRRGVVVRREVPAAVRRRRRTRRRTASSPRS